MLPWLGCTSQALCGNERAWDCSNSGLQEMGLAFDEWDLDYYTNLFKNDMKRDPTNVELFDIAQSNSGVFLHTVYAQL